MLGFDGSYARDATALIGCTLDGHLFVLEIWERPESAGKDWRVPRREVEAVMARAFKDFDVLELAADPPGWHRELEDWAQTYGEEHVIEFSTNQAEPHGPGPRSFPLGGLRRGRCDRCGRALDREWRHELCFPCRSYARSRGEL